MLETNTAAVDAEPSFADRILDDTGSVIEELGFKGLMIAAALGGGALVAAAVAAWAGAIPTP